MKLTGWFPHQIKPVRSGVYGFTAHWMRGYGYAYWDNDKKMWSNGCSDIDGAYKLATWMKGADQRKRWRGIQK